MDRRPLGAGRLRTLFDVLPARPAAAMAVVGVVVVIAVHVTLRGNPAGLVIDLAALLMGGLADRYLRVACLGYGLFWAAGVFLAPGAPMLVESMSFIPVVAAGLQRRFTVLAATSVGYVGLLSQPWTVAEEPTVMLRRVALSVGLFGILWIVAGAIVRLRHAEERRSAERVGQERRAIARELHDSVAHELSLMSMRVQQAQIRGVVLPDDLDFVVDTTERAIRQLRTLVQLLRSDTGEEPTTWRPRVILRAACARAVERLQRDGFSVVESVPEDVPALPLTSECALDGVLHEGVSNILKYGDRAQPVRLTLEFEHSAALLLVNGCATTPVAPPGERFGLVGMAERVRAAGGTFASSGHGGQWVLAVTIPLSALEALPVEEERS